MRNVESVGIKTIRRVGRDEKGREVFKTFVNKDKFLKLVREG
jgi:hypothetical protein